MHRIEIAIILALLVFFAAGCQTAHPRIVNTEGKPSSSPAPSFVTRLLDRALPPTWKGDASLSEVGQFVTLTVEAGNLRREAGDWAFDWLEYQRTLTLPIFTGVPYKQEGKVRLGQRGGKPRTSPPADTSP